MRPNSVAVVHNGIIENFRELREALRSRARVFSTETDTEIVLHLVDGYLNKGRRPGRGGQGDAAAASRRVRAGFIFAGEDDLMIGARNGPPLAIGYGEGEMYLGSDAIALGAVHRHHRLSRGRRLGGADPRSRRTIYDKNDAIVQREAHQAQRGDARWSTRRIIATSWPRKSTSSRKWSAIRWRATSTWRPSGWRCRSKLPFDFKDIQRISIVACGTASYAGFVAKYWFERLGRVPVELDVASEFRYREAPLRKGDLAIFISQSGETADTLAALRYAKSQGVHTLSVVNVPTSTIARESETVLPTLAGPGNRRRLDQGLHLPADGAGRARGRGRQGARRIVRRRREPSSCMAWSKFRG